MANDYLKRILNARVYDVARALLVVSCGADHGTSQDDLSAQ